MDVKALVARLKRKYRTNKYKIKQMHNTEQKTRARYLKEKTLKDEVIGGEVTVTTNGNPNRYSNMNTQSFLAT